MCTSADLEDAQTVTTAANILQSTERVANVLATTLSKDKDSFTISKPNIGTSNIDSIENTKMTLFSQVLLIYPVMNGQLFSINSIRTVVFPGPGVILPSFRKLEVLPHVQLPPAFLSAAMMFSGESPIKAHNL